MFRSILSGLPLLDALGISIIDTNDPISGQETVDNHGDDAADVWLKQSRFTVMPRSLLALQTDFGFSF